MNQAIAETTTAPGSAKTIYILYLVGLVLWPAGIVGVVMAYMNRSDAPDWLQSHYRFQIRTFWIGSLFIITGLLLAMVLIGYLILLFWAIWLIVRNVKGMKYLDQGEEHPNPTGWMFS